MRRDITAEELERLRLEDQVFVLKLALRDALSATEFLHGCLTNPERYKYAYPEMTEDNLKELKALHPDRDFCVHSYTAPDCKSCEAHNQEFERLYRIKKSLGHPVS